MALGAGSIVVDDKGRVSRKSGTSFSSPIMCGMAACLWQALPSLTNLEILAIIKRSSNNYDTPDRDYGYGIPDMKVALEIGQALVAKKEEMKNTNVTKDIKKKK